MGHAANTHYFFCARIKGEPNPNKNDYEKETNKDVLVKAVIASNDYCSSVINGANDKWLMEMVGQGAQARRRGATLSFATSGTCLVSGHVRVIQDLVH